MRNGCLLRQQLYTYIFAVTSEETSLRSLEGIILLEELGESCSYTLVNVPNDENISSNRPTETGPLDRVRRDMMNAHKMGNPRCRIYEMNPGLRL
jgi:hypothetical protein